MLDSPPAPTAALQQQESTIVFSRWMEDLLSQYRAATARPSHRLPLRMIAIAAMLVAAYAAFSPAPLLRLVGAAYPSEPAKQRALELCGQIDPTFVRFLASERASCYAHFPELMKRANAASQ